MPSSKSFVFRISSLFHAIFSVTPDEDVCVNMVHFTMQNRYLTMIIHIYTYIMIHVIYLLLGALGSSRGECNTGFSEGRFISCLFSVVNL